MQAYEAAQHNRVGEMVGQVGYEGAEKRFTCTGTGPIRDEAEAGDSDDDDGRDGARRNKDDASDGGGVPGSAGSGLNEQGGGGSGGGAVSKGSWEFAVALRPADGISLSSLQGLSQSNW